MYIEVRPRQKAEGEKMRRYGLLACLVVLVVTSPASVFAATQQATITIYPGDNWVSAPLVPLNPSPESVFAACLGNWTLVRFEATIQATIDYSSDKFNILLGEGYILHNPTSGTFQCTYEGLPDGVPTGTVMTDMWVSLPGSQIDGQNSGGMSWIGQPFYHDTRISDCLVTDGNSVWTIEKAVGMGVIDGLWNYLDAETQTEHLAGLAALGAYDTYLRPTHMYQVRSHKDNLALIIPGAPVPEPSSVLALACGLGGLLWRKRK
jgi:hypothetical protein